MIAPALVLFETLTQHPTLVALVIPELDEVVGTGTEEHGFC
jgi:hypothetical protein